MSLIHFVNTQPPQKLEEFIQNFNSDMDRFSPLATLALITPAKVPITHQVTFRIGFYHPITRSRTYCEIKEKVSFQAAKESENAEESMQKMMSKELVEKLSGVFKKGILDQAAEHKELISLKIKIRSENSFVPFFKTTLKTKWIKNEPEFTFDQQYLKKK